MPQNVRHFGAQSAGDRDFFYIIFSCLVFLIFSSAFLLFVWICKKASSQVELRKFYIVKFDKFCTKSNFKNILLWDNLKLPKNIINFLLIRYSEQCAKSIYNESMEYYPGTNYYYGGNHMTIAGLMATYVRIFYVLPYPR